MVSSAEIFASYGDLAHRLLPAAARIALYGQAGMREWSHGDASVPDRELRAAIDPIIPGGSLESQAIRLSDTVTAVAVPMVSDGKPIGILLVHMTGDGTLPVRRIMSDVVGTVTPLLDCLCRELSQLGRRAAKSATLVERTAELEWLFSLTESLHSNSNDPRAINQLLGAAVERMKCSFGAVVVSEHGLELTYSSLVHIEIQAAGAFERSRPYYMNYVQRRKEPLIANRASGTTTLPGFKLLVVPIQPQQDRVLGFIAFLKQSKLPNFGRRQLFLGRQIGHQIGALLESQYDLATGLLTRNAFEQDLQRAIAANSSQQGHALIYLDVDHLQEINDRLGFKAGDEAIVRIADLLRPPALPDDAIACRLGGDCFLIFLPDHDADQAARRAEQVLARAADCFVGTEDDHVALTVSAGIVRLYKAESGIVEPLATARLACKSAKEHGGNRTELYLGFASNFRAMTTGFNVHATLDPSSSVASVPLY